MASEEVIVHYVCGMSTCTLRDKMWKLVFNRSIHNDYSKLQLKARQEIHINIGLGR